MSRYTVEDYTAALRALMPTGPVWPGDPDTTQTGVIKALAGSYQRSDDAALSLLSGAFPATATILLSEWERTLGLPDDCSIGEVAGIAMRQTAVVSKLFSTGGQSADYFISVAAAMGYDVSIVQYRQARAGMSVCGDAINGNDYPFFWLVSGPLTTVIYAACGMSYCGDPIRSWGNKRMECRLSALAPSHTIVRFGYINFGFVEEGVYPISSSFVEILDIAITQLPN